MPPASAAPLLPGSDPSPGTSARPFVKWAGGKARLLHALLPHIPQSFNRYHEPFLGGGAVLFAVQARGRVAPRASDLNGELVTAWNVVLQHPVELYARLEEYARNDSETFYYAVRAERHEGALERAAHFIYLNRTSWNGLYRVNRWGQFNVPWGARRFVVPTLDSLLAVGAALGQTEVQEVDFRDALVDVEEDDFVYLDPPYLKVSDTSKFNGYTKRRFRQEDLEDLLAALDGLTRRGVRWVLSNRDSAELREMFGRHEIIRLTVRRAVAAQNRRAIEPSDSPEVIVSNRPLI